MVDIHSEFDPDAENHQTVRELPLYVCLINQEAEDALRQHYFLSLPCLCNMVMMMVVKDTSFKE